MSVWLFGERIALQFRGRGGEKKKNEGTKQMEREDPDTQNMEISCLWSSARIVPCPEMILFPSPPDQFSPLLPVQVLPSTIVILSKLSPFTFLKPCNPSSNTS
ncbi:hypothetical protein JOB18_024880 [Solea senegalensis]|uniref:Uncharacterized protein n=1 Tax=Solea senegalensis TaxID=28829 RepID=A0AAV6RHW0_SOLSE|nr:hypothetical protein JOB18_024880 [Solea senegalensis]